MIGPGKRLYFHACNVCGRGGTDERCGVVDGWMIDDVTQAEDVRTARAPTSQNEGGNVVSRNDVSRPTRGSVGSWKSVVLCFQVRLRLHPTPKGLQRSQRSDALPSSRLVRCSPSVDSIRYQCAVRRRAKLAVFQIVIRLKLSRAGCGCWRCKEADVVLWCLRRREQREALLRMRARVRLTLTE